MPISTMALNISGLQKFSKTGNKESDLSRQFAKKAKRTVGCNNNLQKKTERQIKTKNKTFECANKYRDKVRRGKHARAQREKEENTRECKE